MRRAKIFSKEDALKELAELGALIQRRKKIDNEFMRRFKDLERRVKVSKGYWNSSAPDAGGGEGLGPSSNIGKVIEAYIAYLKKNSTYKNCTINNYASNLRSLEKLMGRRIGISSEDLRAILAETKKSAKLNTYKNKLSALRSLFIWASERGIISSPPEF